MEAARERQAMKSRRFAYPWLSSLVALTIVGWQLGLQLGLLQREQLAPLLQRDDALLLASALLPEFSASRALQ